MTQVQDMKLQISVWSDGEELTGEIVGFWGYFGSGGGSIAQLLGSNNPYIEHVLKEIQHEPYGDWTVFTDIQYVEPETQYGTGYGDILALPGYHMVGNIIEIIKHPPEVPRERAEAAYITLSSKQ